jgi:hypothetical protein
MLKVTLNTITPNITLNLKLKITEMKAHVSSINKINSFDVQVK